jgi:hypothetical protein
MLGVTCEIFDDDLKIGNRVENHEATYTVEEMKREAHGTVINRDGPRRWREESSSTT